MKIKVGTNDSEFRFPGGGKGSLYKWASSDNQEAIEAFDSACQLAFQAFSRSEARVEESESLLESESGIVGALVGGGIAIAVAFGVERRRSREEDEDELIQLSNQLQGAVGRYIQAGHPALAEEEARASGRALYNLLGEWKKYDGSHKNITSAQQMLSNILAEDDDAPLPRIGNLGEESEQEHYGKLLLGIAASIHMHVVDAAHRIGRFRRMARRKPVPPTP